MEERAPNTQLTTKCRVCGHEFKASAFVPYLGQGIDPRLVGMQQKLQQHMMSDQHHQFYAAVALSVCSFEFQDPIVREFVELTRFAVHHTTRKNFPNDGVFENIAHACVSGPEAQALPDSVRNAIAQQVAGALKDLADFLTESGPYAPKLPAPPEAVQP